MRNANPEYCLCRELSRYIQFAYPKALFHFDYAGLAHTKTQAGQMKAIQGKRGFPDLQILEPRGVFHGLFLELKPEGTKLFKRYGDWVTPHLQEQAKMIEELKARGYAASFAIGFQEAKELIDDYMKL